MGRLKDFWEFLKKDTWQSWLVSLVLLIVLIRFIFFPLLSFVTAAPLPIVVVESCSMYHHGDFDDWWFRYGSQYEDFNVEKEDFADFPMRNGLNKGDVIFIWGRSEVEVGDIIVFQTGPGVSAAHPIIHRVVSDSPIGTKGDNGLTNPHQLDGNNPDNIDETSISEEQILGEAKLRVPLIGWVKLIFFDIFRADKGPC